MTAPMGPEAIEGRLRAASDLSDLSAEKRLDAKIDLSPEGIRSRLLEASSLLEACEALRLLGPRRPPTSR
jgi:hypothetical protein